MFSAGYSDHVDRFQGQDYIYGDPRSSLRTDRDEEDDDDDDPYYRNSLVTDDTQDWFDLYGPDDNAGSFKRKLLIVIGRDRDRPFLDSPMGQKLRSRLGKRAGVVFRSKHDDLAVIAFEHSAPSSDLFDQIKGLLPPRLVLDFLMVDIGPMYCTGNAPISIFADWIEQGRNRKPEDPMPPSGGKPDPRTVIVEKKKGKFPVSL